jgi:hypothetical protein
MENNTSKIEKKKMPYSCTKKKLYEIYCQDLTVRQIRNGINTIIKSNRNLPKFHTTKVKQIFNKELVEFIEVYGLPRNYEL